MTLLCDDVGHMASTAESGIKFRVICSLASFEYNSVEMDAKFYQLSLRFKRRTLRPRTTDLTLRKEKLSGKQR